MNPRSLRRLAADHANLHNNDLPPNYLFDPKVDPSSDLTVLDILLAGPQSTPYEAGLFKLHLSIPPTYPTDPPKAFFRTKIFHPNIEPETGAVCVETLKRDWSSSLTFRDVLVTISCLLVQPNPSSALNAEAGMLLEQQGGTGWEGFEKRAKLMTKLQAGVPGPLREAVHEAQRRGEEPPSEKEKEKERQELERKDSAFEDAVSTTTTDRAEKLKKRRRDCTAARCMMGLQDAAPRGRRTRTPSPHLPPAQTRRPPARPFVVQSAADDVFGGIRLAPSRHQTPRLQQNIDQDSDTDFQNGDQENNADSLIATKPILQPTPVPHHAPPIPLGELSIADDFDTTIEDDTLDSEYPPSPKKSPVKQRNASLEHYAEPGPPSPRKESPRKKTLDNEDPPSPRKQSPAKQRRTVFHHDPTLDNSFFAPSSRPAFFRAESSRTAAVRALESGNLFFTPDSNNNNSSSSQHMHLALLSTQTPAGTVHTPAINDTFEDSEFEVSFEVLRQSERKKKNLLSSPPKRKMGRRVLGKTKILAPERDVFSPRLHSSSEWGLDDTVSQFANGLKVPAAPSRKKSSPKVEKPKSPRAVKSAEDKRKEQLEKKMWRLCGGDLEKWNRGDFGGFIKVKASRW
ncbi:hypothetical protein BDV97DRAFT_365522 [Delphinella strobiligena]|nr:hypothetical protein BDV97DRAFT_365522 [Delphinella strobiligena]